MVLKRSIKLRRLFQKLQFIDIRVLRILNLLVYSQKSDLEIQSDDVEVLRCAKSISAYNNKITVNK